MYQTKSFINLFRLICLLTTISLCIYWFYTFSLNEGKSEVRYIRFSPESSVSNIPTLSLCFGNPFLKDQLARYGTDEDSYLSFLEGKSFDEKMMNISFHLVTMNITDYIKDYQIFFKNGSNVKIDMTLNPQTNKVYTSNSFNGFILGGNTAFYKCFSLDIPKIKDLMIFRILLSNKIFKDGLRPTKYKFKTYLHLPQQFLMPGYDYKWTWDFKERASIYKTRFIVRSYELDRKRSTSEHICSENWKNYDNWVMEQFVREVGCRNPYQIYNRNQEICKSQDDIRHSYFYRGIVAEGKYQKPCSTMESVRMEFMETTSKNIATEEFGEFWFGIYFYLDSYKEIIHTR